ncbi:alpha/beta fold hydrolase [Streptomyces sp. NPDC050804]|uniref:alpha/beta fold hydrolase n=1 Tax=Streptomyces sp. NPDC050804 TaxID=3154745 RepID=UPI00344740D8
MNVSLVPTPRQLTAEERESPLCRRTHRTARPARRRRRDRGAALHLSGVLLRLRGREDDFGPARRMLRMYAAPPRGEGPPFDVRGELAGIGAPTLVLAGEADFICGPRWARMIHDDIPGAQLLILEGTGHLGHVENPDGFATAVITFLASVHGDLASVHGGSE